MPALEITGADGFDDAPDGALELASFFGDRIRGQLKQHPEIDRNIRGTLGGLVGSGFPSRTSIRWNSVLSMRQAPWMRWLSRAFRQASLSR